MLLGIISFFIPIVGLIYFFVRMKANLSKAKFALGCAIIGFALNLIYYYNNESDNYEEEYYEEEYYEEDNYEENNYESSSTQNNVSNSNKRSNYITANFRTEIDIRTFLCRNTFRDDEGNTLKFSDMANQLEMNGRVMTTVMNIQSFSHDEANLIFQGPYGRSRFYLSIVDGVAGLIDKNDQSLYYTR